MLRYAKLDGDWGQKGTDGGLDTSVETPLGNIDWEFFHHDETSGAK